MRLRVGSLTFVKNALHSLIGHEVIDKMSKRLAEWSASTVVQPRKVARASGDLAEDLVQSGRGTSSRAIKENGATIGTHPREALGLLRAADTAETRSALREQATALWNHALKTGKPEDWLNAGTAYAKASTSTLSSGTTEAIRAFARAGAPERALAIASTNRRGFALSLFKDAKTLKGDEKLRVLETARRLINKERSAARISGELSIEDVTKLHVEYTTTADHPLEQLPAMWSEARLP